MVSSFSTLLSLLLGVPAAYALGQFRTGGENLSFTVLSILFMPPVAVAIPMYLFWSSLGLLDSYAALILQYTVFNLPFISWVLKSFFEDISRDMEESALVNGATRWRAFCQIAVPLARPAILAVGLLAFIFSWNEFFFALILTRANVTTLPFILPVLMEGHNVLWGDIAAIATLGALPVVILAFVLQNTSCAACLSAQCTSNPPSGRGESRRRQTKRLWESASSSGESRSTGAYGAADRGISG